MRNRSAGRVQLLCSGNQALVFLVRLNSGRSGFDDRHLAPPSGSAMPLELIGAQIPAAAECLVEIDHRDELRLLDARKRLFGLEVLLLGLNDLEIAGPSGVVTLQRQFNRLTASSHHALQAGTLFRKALLRDQSIGCFAEGDEDRLPVLGYRLIPVSLSVAIFRLQAPTGEDRPCEVQTAAPETGCAV